MYIAQGYLQISSQYEFSCALRFVSAKPDCTIECWLLLLIKRDKKLLAIVGCRIAHNEYEL